MPYNGSGVFALSQPSFTPGTTISSASVNSDLSDIATNGLSKCVTIDGQNPITGILKFPNGTAAAPAFTFTGDLTTGMYYIGTKHLGFSTGGTEIFAVNGNNQGSGQTGNVVEINTPSGIATPTCPVGTVLDYAGTSVQIPAGWLLCYGQLLNIATYPELYQIIGAIYGGDNVTTFATPDCRGRVTSGKDNMGGSAANRITAAGGNFDGTVLGGVGGQQNKVIANGNLPANIPLTDPGHVHTAGTGGAQLFGQSQTTFTAGGAGPALTGAAQLSTINTGSSTTGITINAGGANTALPVLSPTIIFNKIIFAGRP